MQMQKNYAIVVMDVKLLANIPLQNLWHKLTHQVDHGKIVLQTYWVLYPLERIYLLKLSIIADILK